VTSRDRVVLLTGSTDGLGARTAEVLAASGHVVLLHGRDRARGDQVLRGLRPPRAGRAHRFYPADLSSFAEVRRLAREVAAEHDRLDVLVNNAGVGTGPPGAGRETSRDGLELRLQVNYLAGFALTALLLPLLQRSTPARVVNVASIGQAPVDFDDLMLERSYDGWAAYRRSKLAQIMFTFELAARLGDDGVTVNALHPATLMDTTMVREMGVGTMSRVEDGVRALVNLVDAPATAGVTGAYFDGTTRARAHPQAYDLDARRRLWSLSEELCGLRMPVPDPASPPGGR